jgi:hypothetical protein
MSAADISNLSIMKGIVSFKKEGESVYRDVGNVTEFETTPEFEELEHQSSREGVKETDKSVVTSRKMTVRMVTDSWDPENVALAMLSDVTQDSEGDDTIDIFSLNAIDGALRFVGTNEVGVRYQVDLPSVSFIPSGSVNWISDEWNTMEITGKVLKVDGSFGTVKKIADEGETPSEADE